jgi:Nucleotide-diphospho-sugar transferase
VIPIPDICHRTGILPFTITNLGYVEFVKSFAERAKKLGMFKKMVVVCTDEASFKLLEKNTYLHCAYYPSTLTKDLTEWKTEEYKKLVFNKLDITREVVKTALKKRVEHVLYIDTDIWLYKDFTKDLLKITKIASTADYIMQDGENYTEKKNPPKFVNTEGIVPGRNCTRLCTGFMIIKPSERTIQSLDYKKTKEVDWKNFVGNQPYLNEVIEKKKLKAIAIDRNLTPNGSIFLDGVDFEPKNPWLIHYTYMLGSDKVKKMKADGHWCSPSSKTRVGTEGTGGTNIFVPEAKPDVFVRCPDGFGNQLRLAMAGSFLVQANHIRSYTQEWVVNNHNNINYTDFFAPLPKVNLTKIKEPEKKNIIETVSFQTLIERYAKNCNWGTAFQIVSRYLLPNEDVLKIATAYAEKNNLRNALGLHVRRTCKDALLKIQPHRSLPLTNEELLPLCQHYPKVFLATDNAETQKWFSERLGDKLAVISKIRSGVEKTKGEYDPKKVVRHTDGLHTVLDFLALKSCGVFHGSNESSFSLLLYHWRNCPYDFHVFGKF